MENNGIVSGRQLVAVAPIWPRAEGFGYSGIQGICIAVLLVLAAALFPLDNLPARIKNIILAVSRYTLGIYCMHRLAGTFIRFVFAKAGIMSDTFLMCVLIYIVCYAVSAVLYQVPVRLCKQLVD